MLVPEGVRPSGLVGRYPHHYRYLLPGNGNGTVAGTANGTAAVTGNGTAAVTESVAPAERGGAEIPLSGSIPHLPLAC